MKEGGGRAGQWPAEGCGLRAAWAGAAAQEQAALREGTAVGGTLHC